MLQMMKCRSNQLFIVGAAVVALAVAGCSNKQASVPAASPPPGTVGSPATAPKPTAAEQASVALAQQLSAMSPADRAEYMRTHPQALLPRKQDR